MNFISKTIINCLILFILASFLCSNTIYAQADTPIPTESITPTSAPPDNSQQKNDLQNKINDLSGKISTLQGQEKTLSSQIGVFDSQIQLTQLRIQSTNEQITTLQNDIQVATKKITTIDSSLDNLTKVLLNKIVATYEVGNAPSTQVLLASSTLSDLFTRINYLRIVQAHDKRLIYDTVQAKNDYANQKNIFENKKKQVESLQAQLQSYTVQINQDKQSKQALLTETQGNEATYQKLLAQAKAELSGFSSFVTSQGGAGPLSGQTSCDEWGCYYNQRDTQWGGIVINGYQHCGFGGVDESCTVAKYGCLITSIAMVASHMGHKDVLPSSIAQSSDGNFAVGTADLRFSINVNGLSINRNGSWGLDNLLTSGPVIVGVHAYGGTHFVVIKSGSNGNYIMNDPFIPGGHDISFTDHYSIGSIFAVNTISI